MKIPDEASNETAKKQHGGFEAGIRTTYIREALGAMWKCVERSIPFLENNLSNAIDKNCKRYLSEFSGNCRP